MAANDQKSPLRVWVETLTPIILALIGIVVPMTTVVLDKCNGSKGPVNEQVATTTKPGNSKPTDNIPPKNNDPKPAPISLRENPKPKEDMVKFKGTVTGIIEPTGISGVKIEYLDTQTHSKIGGSFEIDIPKNVITFVLTAHCQGFKPARQEFNLKRDNGTARIKLIPE